MKQILLVGIILIISIFYSCGIKKQVERSRTYEVDTTTTSEVIREIIYKDTVITIPGDTLTMSIPCDTDTVFIFNKGAIRGTGTVRNKIITITQICDEKDLIITKITQELKEEKVRNTALVSKIEEKIIVPEKYVPKFYLYCTIGFFLFLAYFTGKLAILKIK